MVDCNKFEHTALLARDARDLADQLNQKFEKGWLIWPGFITETQTGIVAIMVRQKQLEKEHFTYREQVLQEQPNQ